MWNSGSGMIGNKMTILNSGRSILKENISLWEIKIQVKLKRQDVFK